MSGIVLESAYYGDEKSFANITKSLAGKIVGGVLEVTAGSDLRPTFEAAPVTKLSSGDEKRIREQAVAACGGEADQACLERTRIKMGEERLRSKELEDLSKSVIKGDRLTINVLDNGRLRRLVTPAGQKLKLENLSGSKTAPDLSEVFSGDEIQKYAITIISVIVGTFFWVFSVAAVYAVFMREYEKPGGEDYWRIIAYVGTGLSLLFPGFGYVIILLVYAIPSFVKEYIAK